MGEMHHPFLVGERVYLRGLERADLAGDYFQWLNDYEVTRYLESGHFPNTPEAMEAYYSSKTASPTDAMFAIADRRNDQMIGTVKLGSINWIHRHAEYGIMIGAKTCWGQGYGAEVARLVLAYGFDRLNLHKITLGVYADHVAAIRSYEKVGFRREGLVASLLYVDGVYHDKVIMGVTAEEFRRATPKE
jgi:RimJ/RimL family protein N-acetyltransferase